MSLLLLTVGLLLFFAASFWCCQRIIPLLRIWGIEAKSNQRSSHVGTVPSGAGLGFLPLLLCGIVVVWAGAGTDSFWLLIVLLAVCLGALSLADDVYAMSVRVRLGAHLVLALVFAWAIPAAYVPEIPVVNEAASRALLAVAVAAWVNIYNFMDGIDGITIVETVSIAVGCAALIMLATGVDGDAVPLVASLTVLSCLAFASINWHPARAFMGDVGSVAVAVIAGGLLLSALRTVDAFTLALVPLYYLVDAGSTLAWRIATLQPFWKAHRSHAYQVFVAKGYPHSTACLVVMGLNAILVLLAISSAVLGPVAVFVTGLVLTSVVIAGFRMAPDRLTV